ncbi:hypothetical protein H7100_03425 [Candidatus Saccharibacteria bacterium]|nr:hypothetical protein [Candidatus Saccharibacteria bacterium]
MFEKLSIETQHRETLKFKGRLLPQLPKQYIEPSLSNDLITPYGAMPANPYLDDAVKHQQRNINEEYSKLYALPPGDEPQSFVEAVVVDDYVINEERRKMENFEGFMEFVRSGTYLDPSLQAEMKLFEKGHATINQAIHFVLNSGIQKGEFGKVTHPYGYRMQELEPFRVAMDKAIEFQGGVVYPTVAPYRSIKILPKVKLSDDGSEFGKQEIVGFIVKYKRDYGHIPVPGQDNEVLRIIERQIAAYRVDEASGFDQEVLQAMHDFCATYPKRIRWDRSGCDDGKKNEIFYNRLKMTGCANFIENAVQTDALDDFVVPISTTIYGYKETLPEIQPVDHKAHLALELTLHRQLDALPGAYGNEL